MNSVLILYIGLITLYFSVYAGIKSIAYEWNNLVMEGLQNYNQHKVKASL